MGCSSGGNSPNGKRVVSLEISGDNEIAANFSTQLKVTAIYNDKTSKDVTSIATWSQSGETGIIQVLPEGIVEGLATGSATVTVRYDDSQSVTSANFTMNVNDSSVTGLFITPIVDILGSPYRIPNGTFISVAGLANFSDGRQLVDITRDLSWTVDQSNIVTVEPKDFEVKLTGQSLGVTTLTVDVSDPSQSAQTNVAVQQILTVTNAVLTELLISPSSLSLPKAINQQLSVAGVYSDNSILIDIPEVSWSVEDDRIARISEDGLLSTYLDGQTKVLVSLDLIQAEAELVVNDATVESLVVSPAEASIVEGSKIDYNATVTFSDGTEADYTEKVDWYSSNSSVAEVYNGNTIRGLHEGQAEIFAVLKVSSSADTNEVLQSNPSGRLDVFEARITDIDVETVDGNPDLPMIVSKSESLVPIDQLQIDNVAADFKAQATYEDGSSQDITLSDDTHWTIVDDQDNLDSSIAVVADGRVIGLGSGNGAVKAENDNIRDSSPIVTTGCPSLKVLNPRPGGSGVMYFSCPLRDTEATDAQISYGATSRGDGIRGPEFDFITHSNASVAADYCDNLNLDGHNDWELARYSDLVRLIFYYDSNNDSDYLFFTEHNWPAQTNFWIADRSGKAISLAEVTTEPVSAVGSLLSTCVRIQPN
ncbi:hypothetical protein A3715_06530 [Oleiphilus sp. HI0009]|nr:hypothetical protein A3715_06530 [Oleiphilus sp. HI0009]